MIRTSIILPPSLHQRLSITARQRGQRLSEYVREILNQHQSVQEQAAMQHFYEGLRQLEGIGPEGITDAASTIDEALYGKQGAWRGMEPPNGHE
jgi:predicted DNA-binding protein